MKTILSTAAVALSVLAAPAVAFDSTSTIAEVGAEYSQALAVYDARIESRTNPTASNIATYQSLKADFKSDWYNICNTCKIQLEDYGQVSIFQLGNILETVLVNMTAELAAPDTPVTIESLSRLFGFPIPAWELEDAINEVGNNYEAVVRHLNEFYGV